MLGSPLKHDSPVNVCENDLNYYALLTDNGGPAMTWITFAIGYLDISVGLDPPIAVFWPAVVYVAIHFLALLLQSRVVLCAMVAISMWRLYVMPSVFSVRHVLCRALRDSGTVLWLGVRHR